MEKSATGEEYEHLTHEYEGRYCAVSIIRAGDSMLGEVQAVMPEISVGKILIQRDESTADKRPVFYYSKLPPDIASRRVLLVDPMIGTGGSCKAAIECLIKAGVPEEQIVFINLICCQEGVDAILAAYPKIKLVSAKKDPILNANKYLVPGLGDFGDRYFGTVDH